MNNGILYSVFDKFLNGLRYVSIVELFKFIAVKISPKISSRDVILRNLRASVDLFIVLKWLLVIFLILGKVSHSWATVGVWYLVATNLYTYFYFHTWSSDILTDPYMDIDRIKRRFLNLLQAILFTIFAFTYLYAFPYSHEFIWEKGETSILRSVWYSVSNSLTASYNQVAPSSDLGNSVSMIQLLIMFAFLTIIIGGSVPQTRQDRED